MKKKDKVSLVEAHIAMKNFSNISKETELELDEEVEEEDVVLYKWGTSQDDEEAELFCISREPEDERFMVCCDECDEWYHGECLDLSEQETETYKNDPDVDFICPFCIVT